MDSGSFPLLLSLIGVVVAPALTYVVATRRTSGRVDTTEAEKLWDESRGLKAELAAEKASLSLETRDLRADNYSLRNEVLDLRTRVQHCEMLVTHCEAREAMLIDRLRQAGLITDG